MFIYSPVSNKRPSGLLILEIFVRPPSFGPRLLSFFKKIPPSKFNSIFFLEYCSTEIVMVSSIFFVAYEFETFETQIRMPLIIEYYHYYSNRVSLLVEI